MNRDRERSRRLMRAPVSLTAEPRRRTRLHLRALRGLLAIGSLALISGCALQSAIIQARHWDLNETIRQTTDEQLLLNLVRLRYDEQPYFLQVSSITTNFTASASLGASGTFPDGADNIFGVDTGVSYSESPSVTWAIPDSREFLGRLHAPVGADQLTVLSQAGFDPRAVFRVGTRRMNQLRNKEFEITEGEFVPDSYDEFVEALALIEELRREDVLDLSFAAMSAYGGATVPLEQLDTRAVAQGFPNRLYFFERPQKPGVVSPRVLLNPLVLRFAQASDTDPRALRLRALLKLDPEMYSFPITNTTNASPELLRTESGDLSTIFDPSFKLKHIMLNNRSVMEILRFAAASVDVPAEVLAAGAARASVIQDRDFLNVRTSRSKPRKAWLKVEYQANWYFIPEDDLEARASFSLLGALFASVVGTVPGAKPVLTLPVN